ncbi:MAG: hypothetical protein CVU68_14445 [Deltaproteobacteria bacterium HGW-Deltaproteobacteria-3]|nr:MAG: hypothetical protein CVU68_14445 [Deltaproteobacteria bacterium HGW-Deltaproteobacteria-3]
MLNPPFSKGEAQPLPTNQVVQIIPPFEKGGRGGILTVCLILQFSYRTTLINGGNDFYITRKKMLTESQAFCRN